jgi:biofilm protein TabA
MICDLFENIGLYCKKGDRLHQAITYARDFDLSQPDGEYEVQGRNIFAKVMAYETSPAEERTFEAHSDYIDVQVIREGAERMDVSLGEKLGVLTPYDAENDVVKLNAPAQFSSIAVRPGMFVVFFPQDVHRPNCRLDGVSRNRKICMKVRA